MTLHNVSLSRLLCGNIHRRKNLLRTTALDRVSQPLASQVPFAVGAQLPRRQMSRSRAITRRGEAKHRRVGGNPGSCLRPPVQPYPEMTTAAWLRPSDRALPSRAASFDELGRRHTFDRSATSQSPSVSAADGDYLTLRLVARG